MNSSGPWSSFITQYNVCNSFSIHLEYHLKLCFNFWRSSSSSSSIITICSHRVYLEIDDLFSTLQLFYTRNYFIIRVISLCELDKT